MTKLPKAFCISLCLLLIWQIQNACYQDEPSQSGVAHTANQLLEVNLAANKPSSIYSNPSAQSALYHAVTSGSISLADVWLNLGATLKPAQDQNGRPPMHWLITAIEHTCISIEKIEPMVHFLITHGIPVDQRYCGLTALELIVNPSNENQLHEFRTLAQAIVDHGVSLDFLNNLIFKEIKQFNSVGVKLLLEIGASPNNPDKQTGKSPLQFVQQELTADKNINDYSKLKDIKLYLEKAQKLHLQARNVLQKKLFAIGCSYHQRCGKHCVPAMKEYIIATMIRSLLTEDNQRHYWEYQQ